MLKDGSHWELLSGGTEEDGERPSQIVLYHDRSPLHTNFLVKEEGIEVNVKK